MVDGTGPSPPINLFPLPLPQLQPPFLSFPLPLPLSLGRMVDGRGLKWIFSLDPMLHLKADFMDLQFESAKRRTPWGYVSAIVLCIAMFGTIALTGCFFLEPNATFDDYIADVLPLFGGFLSILGISEIATMGTATQYGVKLSPTFLIPSNWTGSLGDINNRAINTAQKSSV